MAAEWFPIEHPQSSRQSVHSLAILRIRRGHTVIQGWTAKGIGRDSESDPLCRSATPHQAFGNGRLRDNEEGRRRDHDQPGPGEAVDFGPAHQPPNAKVKPG